MSFYPNGMLKSNHLLNWKIFVKEKNCISECSNPKKKFSLTFTGNDAKDAYEEIISETPAQQLTKRNPNIRLRLNVHNNTSINDRSTETESKTFSANGILKAVEQGDLAFIHAHISADNVNISDSFGWTPLMSASYSGHYEIVKYLLQIGAKKDTTDRSGFTAISLALKKSHLNIVALLENTITSPNKEKDISQSASASSHDLTKKHVIKPFYCDVCETNFKETSKFEHESSTLHIFNENPKLPVIYGLSKQNRGYRIMVNTGWDEEKGLGPSGGGPKYPIKTVLKRDRKGLGNPETSKNKAKVTHFNSRDVDAVKNTKMLKQNIPRMKDRVKQLTKEARKERALRLALS